MPPNTLTHTQVTKQLVGRLRPSFLSLCQPAGEGNAATLEYGQSASANPACTAAESTELTDAHYSFPSGHTSSVFVLSTWAAVYCVWAFSMRPPVSKSAAQLARMSVGGRLAHEAGAAAAWLWVLLQLGWAWAVGVSRITDFK